MAEGKKKSKNQLRRERAKAKKLAERGSGVERSSSREASEINGTTKKDVDDYVNDESQAAEQVDIVEYGGMDQILENPQFAQYKNIMDKFHTEENRSKQDTGKEQEQIFYSDNESDEDNDDNDTGMKDTRLSKKKTRKLQKPGLAELKAYAPRPDLVEWYDADAPDPKLVVQLKAARGAVPVPEHWLHKRDYLSGKRGIKKAPFDLPEYIKVTGIMDMRDALKEDDSTLRQKMRERVQPKMGQLDVDYQKLHDAFFKFQTKPRLFHYGEVYYEGKEHESDYSKFRPGKLSDKLIEALNIPPNAPPPYLLNMQRYGPPPSYPGLKIPGLNAPIPPGAQWGFQPGGYGRPPLDERGVPLYGDVYGVSGNNSKNSATLGIQPERNRWGELIEEEEEEESEEEEEEGQDSDEQMEENAENDDEKPVYIEQEEAEAAGPEQPIELRKTMRVEKDSDSDDGEPKQLYQVLESKETSSEGFFGAGRKYEIPQQEQPRKRRRFEEPQGPTRESLESDIDNLIQTTAANKKKQN